MDLAQEKDNVFAKLLLLKKQKQEESQRNSVYNENFTNILLERLHSKDMALLT